MAYSPNNHPAHPQHPPPPPPPSHHGLRYTTPHNSLERTPSYRAGDDQYLFDPNNVHGAEAYRTASANNGGGGGAGSFHTHGSLGSQLSVDSSQQSILSHSTSPSSYQQRYDPSHHPPPLAPGAPPSAQSYNPQHFMSPVQQQPITGYNPQAFAPFQSPSVSSYHSSLASQWQSPQIQQTPPSALHPTFPPRPYELGYAQAQAQTQAQAHRPLAASTMSTGYVPMPNTPHPQPTAASAYTSMPMPPPPPPRRTSWVDNTAPYTPSATTPYALPFQPVPSYAAYTPSPPSHSPDPSSSARPPDEPPTAFPGVSSTTPYSLQPQQQHPPPLDAAPAPPVHQTTQVPSRRTDTLARHPQARPLPGPPTPDEDSPVAAVATSRNGREPASVSYDDIVKEVEAAIMEGRPQGTRRQSSHRIHSQLPPPDEGAENTQNNLVDGVPHSHQHTHTNGLEHHIGSTGTGQYVNYDAYSDDSEAEAAAGVAALRMAEEEEEKSRTRRNTHSSARGSQGFQPSYMSPITPTAPSALPGDSAYGGYAPYGAGYDAHPQYGETTGATQDGGVTTSGSFRSSDRSTDGYDYPRPGSPARVDALGTGGLSEPSLYPRRRMSFDDGDETGMAGSDTRTSSVGETPDEYEPQDLFFHPGMSSRPLPPPPAESPIIPPNNLIPHLMPAGTYRPRDQQQQPQEQQQLHLQTQLRDQVEAGQRGTVNQYEWAPHTPAETMGRPHANTTPSAPVLQPLIPQATPPLVPRSSSLNSHAPAPRPDPNIMRSKTDADRVKIKLPGSAYESSVSSPAVPVDLLPTIPAGKRKKFNPAKLSTEQFKKCSEPWALSSIVAWVKDLAEDETDLKEQTVVDGLVALFTHKVPTMNTADAETLAARVVKDMLAVGVLVQDEEWVKFGPETLCGVLWQITGQGCYSSRLHLQDSEFPGRCYSHHCMRTLKKINLQAESMEPEKKAEDWATFYKIGKEVFDTHSKKEIDRQNNLHEIVTTEDSYIAQLDVLRTLYRDQLASCQPPVISPKRIDKFLRDVFGKVDAMKRVNEDFLLAQLKYRQKEQGPFIVGFSDIFREWIRKAKTAYIEYAATFPNANYLMRREMETNLLFRQFLDQARENKMSNRLSWDTYLKSPITRIQRYTLMLSGVHKNMIKDSEEKANLAQAIEEIRLVAMDCDNKVGEMTKKVDLRELGTKLQLRPELKRSVELNLEHLGREIIYQGDLQRPRTKRFNWVDTRAILFDHYLVLAKVVGSRDPSKSATSVTYDVSKLPIPMDLLVLVSRNDDPVMRSGVRGIVAANPRTGGGPANTPPAGANNTMASTTVLENPGEDRILYPFRIKHLGKEIYVLYAPTSQIRQEWCDKIVEAKTKHASSLHAQNAEPFKLRVLSDSAFAYSDLVSTQKSAVIKGTPLDRAIREVEKKYESNLSRPLPVCRASVNCATVFQQPPGRMCAIGTDYGVYFSEFDNPRGWRRAVAASRVTQISVFEEFNLLLLIADKSLIAYHLDVVCPVNGVVSQSDSQRCAPQKLSGNREVGFFAAGRMKDRALVFYKKREGISSTFKVLEPVLQKSNASRPRFMRRGQTEFFREYDEFYIPADSYSINLFHTSLAISTSRGVEVLTLDKKQPWSVPNLRSDQPEAQTHLSSVANRIKDLRPLGMFRLSESEFLVVFEECAVYVNKHGDVSRSVVMEFVGHAHSACLCGKFLMLFNEDFVEIRNAMNGRLRQVIAGQNVTLLDDGGNNGNIVFSGGGAQGTPASVGGGANFSDGHHGHGTLSGFGTTVRSVKICMQHPEHERSQIVLELVENERQKD